MRHTAILFGLILGFGCEKSPPAVTAPRAGGRTAAATMPAAGTPAVAGPTVFDYTGSLAGSPVVRGALELVAEDGEFVSGTWRLARVPGSGGPAFLGQQVGEGELAVRKSQGRLVFNTTNFADHEVIMVADVVGVDEISGVWQYRSFSGIEAEGPFVARRRK